MLMQQQYLGFHTGFGSRFSGGEATLDDCEEQAKKYHGDLPAVTNCTEHWEAVFSRYI